MFKMLQIQTKNGKPYIGNLEVSLEPIFLGLEGDLGFEPGKAPPFDLVLGNIVADLYKKGFNLFDANAYRYFIVGQINIPEANVPDGKVSASIKRKVVFDFYRVEPIAQKNQQA